MRKLRNQLPSCVSVRHMATGHFRVSLRIWHIQGMRPDWILAQCCDKAEWLAAYVPKTDDPEHDWLEVRAIAEELAMIEELDDALVA